MSPELLLSNPKNFRTHPTGQVQALTRSLGEYGWVQPLLWNRRTGHLIDGHARLDLARSRGDETVPVLVLDIPEPQEGRLLASLDRITQLAGTNDQKLAGLLSEWQDENLGLPPGWNNDDLDQILTGLLSDKAGEVERLPGAGGDDFAGAIPTRTHAGEVWQLGEHRIAVGDCRDTALLDRLLSGQVCSLALVDPPYGNATQKRHGSGKGYGRGGLGARTIEGDEDTDLLCALPDLLHPRLATDAHALVFCQWRTYPDLARAFTRGDYSQQTVIVWDKGRPGLSGSDSLAEQHEWLCAFEKGHPSEPGGRGGNVWRIGAVTRFEGRRLPHPHLKPVELLDRALQQFSKAGGTVLDVCAGSGSTLIACQRAGRVCYAVEINPRYCDLAIARWEAETRSTATLREEVTAHGAPA
jgi:hypothetical protein